MPPHASYVKNALISVADPSCPWVGSSAGFVNTLTKIRGGLRLFFVWPDFCWRDLKFWMANRK